MINKVGTMPPDTCVMNTMTMCRRGSVRERMSNQTAVTITNQTTGGLSNSATPPSSPDANACRRSPGSLRATIQSELIAAAAQNDSHCAVSQKYENP